MAVPGIKGDQIEDNTLNQDDIQFKDDASDNATTLKPGLLRKLSGVATDFLNGLGEWVTVTASASGRQITGVTLPQAGWSLNAGLYEYTYSNALITASHAVEPIPANASIATIKAAEILPRTDSAAGSVKFYATNAPAADIVVDLILFEVA